MGLDTALKDKPNRLYLPEALRQSAEERIRKLSAERDKEKTDWPDEHLVGPDGKPVPFHDGQLAAWNSERRIVAMIAGSQSGKVHGVLGGYIEKWNASKPMTPLRMRD